MANNFSAFFDDTNLHVGDNQFSVTVPFACTLSKVKVKSHIQSTGVPDTITLDFGKQSSVNPDPIVSVPFWVAGSRPVITTAYTVYDSGAATVGAALLAGDVIWLSVVEVGATIAGGTIGIVFEVV